METTTALRTALQGAPVCVRTPARETTGNRKQLQVLAYKKGGGKVKGGYGGTEPNAKIPFCKVDSSGRKSKGYGAYRFAKKYGDINDYSPIYDEYDWAAGGNTYALGPQGITAWGGLLAVGLGVGVYLIVATSSLF